MRGPKQECTLQKDFPTATGTGSTPGWHPVQSFRGVLSPVSQREQKLADKDTEFREYLLSFRREDIAPRNHDEIKVDNRIVIGTRYYDIIASIQYPGRGEHWQLRLMDITDRRG
jgi:hypothetical protein